MPLKDKLKGKTTGLAAAPGPAPDLEAQFDAAGEGPPDPGPDSAPAVEAGRFMEIEPNRLFLNPWQPRKHFDQAALKGLAESIKEHGVMQPLTVAFSDQRVFVVAGERRLKAAEMVGLERVPCVVTDKDPEVLAVVENVQRQDLTPLEEAEAYARLQRNKGFDLAALEKLTGKAKSTISEILSLAKLPEPVKEAARKAPTVSRRALVELAKIREPDNAVKLLTRVLSGELTSDGLKEMRRRMQPEIPKAREAQPGAAKPAPAAGDSPAAKGTKVPDLRTEIERQTAQAILSARELYVRLRVVGLGVDDLAPDQRGELSKELRNLAQAMDPVFSGLKRLRVRDEKEAGLLEVALRRALHSFQGAGPRWEARRRQGLSDASMVVAISEEFGDGGEAGTDSPHYQTKGNKRPEFRVELPSGEIKLTGQVLVDRARALLEIPQPARERA